jgi:hypothetical protein
MREALLRIGLPSSGGALRLPTVRLPNAIRWSAETKPDVCANRSVTGSQFNYYSPRVRRALGIVAPVQRIFAPLTPAFAIECPARHGKFYWDRQRTKAS